MDEMVACRTAFSGIAREKRSYAPQCSGAGRSVGGLELGLPALRPSPEYGVGKASHFYAVGGNAVLLWRPSRE